MAILFAQCCEQISFVGHLSSLSTANQPLHTFVSAKKSMANLMHIRKIAILYKRSFNLSQTAIDVCCAFVEIVKMNKTKHNKKMFRHYCSSFRRHRRDQSHTNAQINKCTLALFMLSLIKCVYLIRLIVIIGMTFNILPLLRSMRRE